jgi:hypothetical protein
VKFLALSLLAISSIARAAPSAITMTVRSTSGEGTWSCILDLWISAEVSPEKEGDRVTITVHDPHARMEAAASSGKKFAAQIASESPGQQQAIAQLDGKSTSFTIDRKTGGLRGKIGRFDAAVSFAGIDAAYWFAQVWLMGRGEHGAVARAHPTLWGVPWKLWGQLEPAADGVLASQGSLEGDLTVGHGSDAIARHLTLAIAPRQ